jgi:hypothetical protein
MTNVIKTLGLLGLMTLATQRGAEALEQKVHSTNSQKSTSSYSIKKSTPSYDVNKSTSTKPVEKKNQVYLIGGQSMLNPAEYNNEIKKVSVSPESIYGPVSTAGIGYQRDLSNKVAGRLEISMNSQNKPAYKHDIPTNTDIQFGYNELVLYNIDPEAVYKIPISSKTSMEVGLGPAITVAKVTSANETDKATSTTAMVGAKVSLDLCQTLRDWFVKYGVEVRTGSVENLDISAPAIRLKLGRRF